jgi:hypothetical protein
VIDRFFDVWEQIDIDRKRDILRGALSGTLGNGKALSGSWLRRSSPQPVSCRRAPVLAGRTGCSRDYCTTPGTDRPDPAESVVGQPGPPSRIARHT